MTEKRRYPRYSCSIKTTFEYWEGDPAEIDTSLSTPSKGRGVILDISLGGLFMISDERVSIGQPIKIPFSTKKGKFSPMCRVVRTGMLKHNPTEIAQKFAKYASKGDYYIAVEFDALLPELAEKDV